MESALKNVPSYSGQVVNSINGVSSTITLVFGDNVTIISSGNTLRISAAGTALRALVNPLQVATLHWYGVNQSSDDKSAGLNQRGIAFNGAHMWESNYTGQIVTRLRRVTAQFSATFSHSGPADIAFDGVNIWVCNSDSIQRRSCAQVMD